MDEKIELSAFSLLRKKGLRVTKGLDTRGKYISVNFEAPAQINNAQMFLYQNLSIGMYSYARTGTLRHLSKIGRYCSIGPNATLGEPEHPTKWLSTSPAQYHPEQFSWYPPERDLAQVRNVVKAAENDDGARGKIAIGNDVWIGANVTVSRGIRIGDGAIIGANAFVNKNVEPYSIVAGLPARLIRYRFSEQIRQRLMILKWWRFNINDLVGVQFNDIEQALDEIERRERLGLISPQQNSFRQVFLSSNGFCDQIK